MSGPSPSCSSVRWGPGLFAASLATLVAVPHLHAQEVELRRRYQAGDDFRHQQVQSTRSITPMGNITQTITMVHRETVLAVTPDGSVKIRVTNEFVQVAQETPTGRTEYDSRSGGPRPANPMFAALTALAGKSYEMMVDQDGKPAYTPESMTAFREELVAAIAVDNPQLAARMRQTLMSANPGDLMGSVSTQGDQAFPSHPVAPGAEWSGEVSVESPLGATTVLHQYTLRDVTTVNGRRVARIDVKGSMARDAAVPSIPAPDVMGAIGGDVTGEMEVDVERGLLLRSTMGTVLNVEVMGQALRTESSIRIELLP